MRQGRAAAGFDGALTSSRALVDLRYTIAVLWHVLCVDVLVRQVEIAEMEEELRSAEIRTQNTQIDLERQIRRQEFELDEERRMGSELGLQVPPYSINTSEFEALLTPPPPTPRARTHTQIDTHTHARTHTPRLDRGGLNIHKPRPAPGIDPCLC